MLLDNLYLWLDLFALSYPLAQSFEHRLQYYKKWYALAIGLVHSQVFSYQCSYS